jgi:hypothetical protein
MSKSVNEARFERDDPEALTFFKSRGFVVLRGVLGESDRADVERAWDEIVAEGAHTIGMSPGEFASRYPQNRDLWQRHPGFRKLLFETGQGPLASRFLGTSGVRLFHDHAIAKPAHTSGLIPWHQDSAYWPLDRVGLSIWTPTADAKVDGGCLEVLDGSHLDGPGTPQDFLASGDRAAFDDDPRLTALPVERGESVVLHGLTWHRSQPNVAAGRRLAYLTLWVPATARFRPEHASWHPTARHIAVAPGERLDGDLFPLFGRVAEEDEGDSVVFPHPHRTSGPSMFTASKDIGAQIAWLLRQEGVPSDARDPLADPAIPDRVVEACVRRAYLTPDEREALLQVLEELHTNDEVRKRSVARDVYLQSPLRWWKLVGTRIAKEMGRGEA